ncbi:MAG: glycine zipper domain-containing protein [Pseudomonadota bacterium]
MRTLMIAAALTLSAATAGCATLGRDDYASACERDYARNRELATASGAALGAAIGAAVAGDGDRRTGAAIGAAAGALLGNQLSKEDDPCGYGFGGYNNDRRYGTERIDWRDDDRRYDGRRY